MKGKYCCNFFFPICFNEVSVCNRYLEAREKVIDSEIVYLAYRTTFPTLVHKLLVKKNCLKMFFLVKAKIINYSAYWNYVYLLFLHVVSSRLEPLLFPF